VLVAPGIHAHGANHNVVAKRHAVHVDDDRLQLATAEKDSTSASEASIVCRLTLDLETPIVSAISGITLRY